MPQLTPIQVLILASRKALLTADDHDDLRLATEHVVTSMKESTRQLARLGPQQDRIEQLNEQIRGLGEAPVPDPWSDKEPS